jgi:hypothetical protein
MKQIEFLFVKDVFKRLKVCDVEKFFQGGLIIGRRGKWMQYVSLQTHQNFLSNRRKNANGDEVDR